MNKGIIAVLSSVMGAVTGGFVVSRETSKATNKAQDMSNKHLALFLLMNQWVAVKQEGKHLKDYFKKNNYKTIAVYGMSYAGERLVDELRDSGIIIKYGIDRNAASIYSDIDIVTADGNLEEVDAVVVTPIYFFNEIEEMLEKKVSCPIISLEDILYEV